MSQQSTARATQRTAGFASQSSIDSRQGRSLRNLGGVGASLSLMTQREFQTSTRSRRDRSMALWIPLAVGLLLMFLAAAARGESAQAKRADRFHATLSSSARLRIDNISGDIVATLGREFSAVVTVVVTAPTQSRELVAWKNHSRRVGRRLKHYRPG